MPDLLSLSAYGRMKGWSHQYVSKLAKGGKIPLVDGKVDPELADAALLVNRDPGRENVVRANAARRGEPPPITVVPGTSVGKTELFESDSSRATARDRLAAARLKELQLEREAGKLVESARVIAATAEAFAPIMLNLEGVPNRIAPMLIGENDVRRIIATLEQEIETVRRVIADTLRAMAASVAATKQ